jgi:hypothetical protein
VEQKPAAPRVRIDAVRPTVHPIRGCSDQWDPQCQATSRRHAFAAERPDGDDGRGAEARALCGACE